MALGEPGEADVQALLPMRMVRVDDPCAHRPNHSPPLSLSRHHDHAHRMAVKPIRQRQQLGMCTK